MLQTHLVLPFLALWLPLVMEVKSLSQSCLCSHWGQKQTRITFSFSYSLLLSDIKWCVSEFFFHIRPGPLSCLFLNQTHIWVWSDLSTNSQVAFHLSLMSLICSQCNSPALVGAFSLSFSSVFFSLLFVNELVGLHVQKASNKSSRLTNAAHLP